MPRFDPLVLLPRPAVPAIGRIHGWQRNSRTAARLYRITPPALRRPEPALRAGTAGATAWFAVLFLALGLATMDGTGESTPLDGTGLGYLSAALMGGAGLVCVATHRLRPAAWCLGTMLVLGQVVSLVAVL